MVFGIDKISMYIYLDEYSELKSPGKVFYLTSFPPNLFPNSCFSVEVLEICQQSLSFYLVIKIFLMKFCSGDSGEVRRRGGDPW